MRILRPGSSAPLREPRSPPPAQHRRAANNLSLGSLPEAPTRGLSSGGAGPGISGTPGGDRGLVKRATSPTLRTLATLGINPPHFSVTPIPGSRGKRLQKICRFSLLVLRTHLGPDVPGIPPYHPGDSLHPLLWLSLDPPTRSSARGLGAAARDVQTQLSAGAIDSRIAFGQSGAAARGGEGREAHGRKGGMETPRGNRDIHKMGLPLGRGGARVGGVHRGRMSGVGSGQKPLRGL